MAFTPRLSAPSTSNKYYYSLNPFHQSGYGLPNCTCYAYGRFYEISGSKPKLSLSNAENWWGHKDGYKRGQTPKLGAVICWRKGKAGNGADGAGHVGIVEAISGNKITVSMSAWGGTRWYLQTFTIGKYNYNGFIFQGFIYNPKVTTTTTATSKSSTPSYAAGKDYVLKANMKVRAGAGTNYRWKKRSELTADGRKHAQTGTYAVLKTGTKVTCQKVVKKGSEVWLKIPSGYVCAKQGSVYYIK